MSTHSAPDRSSFPTIQISKKEAAWTGFGIGSDRFDLVTSKGENRQAANLSVE